MNNGTNNANRSNARTLDWEGNEVLAGSLTVIGVTTTTLNGQTVGNNPKFTDTDELANLKDVDFTNLTDGQVIVWNATAGKFSNITLPDPMVFRGSLGTGGTITTLPVDGSATIGDTYKVITDGTYAGQTAKVGDTFICLTKTLSANTWVHIPSGDEPSGTVTSVKIEATSPIVVDDASAITTSGVRTLSHADSGATAGSYGDSTAQTPAYGATFKVPYITVDAKGHITEINEHTVKIPASDNTDTQSDWNVTDTTSPAYINNKPAIPAKTSDLNNDSGFIGFTDITDTLTAGQTSITLSDASITSSSFIQVFAGNGNINYTSISVATGSVTIGFLAQASDMTVTVRVS
jgi:hypothetical protein